MNEYEKKEAELKNKHEIIIENDKEEIKKLKEELLKIQIEKDNIAEKNTSNEELLRNIESECNLEKNKIYQNYINAKNDLNLIEEKKTEEIQNLTMRNKNLENKNSELEKELEILRMNEKKRIKIMNDMQTNLYELQNELNRMNIEKRNNNDENNRIKNEKEKLIAIYESKIKKITENYENKIFYLEDIKDKQNKKLSLLENKAIEMVKSQQLITDKYKKELNNAVSYYEGIINNISSKEGNISNNNFA